MVKIHQWIDPFYSTGLAQFGWVAFRSDPHDGKERRDVGAPPLEYAGGTMIVRSIPA